MHYIIYARKSQDREERQVQSIGDQLRLDRQLAAARGLEVAEEIVEAKSAKEPGQRPGFARMIDLIEQGKIGGIVAWHPDRLSRNEVDAAAITYLLRKGKLRDIAFANYGFDNTPEGIMMLQMALSQSQYFSSKLGKDVMRGMESKIRKGWSPHRAPEGYLNDPLTRTIVPDPGRFDMVRKGWELLLSGTYSVPEIADKMNGEWGFTTRPSQRTAILSGPTDGEEQDGSGRIYVPRGGGPISRTGLYRLFHNPFYAGYFVSFGETHKGSHPSMVTLAEFERAQEILARQGNTRPKGNEYPFTGLVRCRCGCMVTAICKAGRHGRGTYVYYHCTNARRVCTKVGLRAEAMEAQIEGLLRSVEIDPDMAAAARTLVARWHGTQTAAQGSLQNSQFDALSEASQRLDRLLDLRLRDLLSEEQFAEKQRELTGEVRRMRASLEETEREFESVKESATNALEFLEKAPERFLVGNYREKREIASALGISYSFDRGVLSVETHPALHLHLAFKKVSPQTVPAGAPKSRSDETALIGYRKQKEPLRVRAVPFGGPDSTSTEYIPNTEGAEALYRFFLERPRFPFVSCLETEADV